MEGPRAARRRRLLRTDGNLFTQGREIADFKPFDPEGYVANSPMVWSAIPYNGNIFFADTNSGLWAVKLQRQVRPVS